MTYDEWTYEKVTTPLFHAVTSLITRTTQEYQVYKQNKTPIPPHALADEQKIDGLLQQLKLFDRYGMYDKAIVAYQQFEVWKAAK
jgi:hypothetical protein